MINKLFDETAIQNFGSAKGNKKLIKSFNNAVSLSFNETEVIDGFSNDLKKSFLEIKKELKPHGDSKIQMYIYGNELGCEFMNIYCYE